MYVVLAGFHRIQLANLYNLLQRGSSSPVSPGGQQPEKLDPRSPPSFRELNVRRIWCHTWTPKLEVLLPWSSYWSHLLLVSCTQFTPFIPDYPPQCQPWIAISRRIRHHCWWLTQHFRPIAARGRILRSSFHHSSSNDRRANLHNYCPSCKRKMIPWFFQRSSWLKEAENNQTHVYIWTELKLLWITPGPIFCSSTASCVYQRGTK